MIAASPCNLSFRLLLAFFVGGAVALNPSHAADAADKPVLLYSRYFNAEGEARYLPDGNFKEVLSRLRHHFEVRVDREPLTDERLANVRVVLLANPSDQAVSNKPAPAHVSLADARLLARYLGQGGGLIVMGNQENHNLETKHLNALLSRFGLQFTNLYTDAKQLVLPASTPLIGGLKWGYYTGNLVLVQDGHPAHPRALVSNDLKQKPIKGTRDQPGALLAIAEPGFGRLAVFTDTGFITDEALGGKGIGGVTITEQDNWEIFLRLARWTAHAPEKGP